MGGSALRTGVGDLTMAIGSAVFNLLKNERDVRAHAAQQTIFERGQPGTHMFVVLDGQVDVTFEGRTLNSHGPGEVFGEMALIDAQPRSATAVARTDCRLAAIDERRFVQLVQGHPFFALDVMRILAERLRLRSQGRGARGSSDSPGVFRPGGGLGACRHFG
jgi:CRP-like cAMP-binding protein